MYPRSTMCPTNTHSSQRSGGRRCCEQPCACEDGWAGQDVQIAARLSTCKTKMAANARVQPQFLRPSRLLFVGISRFFPSGLLFCSKVRLFHWFCRSISNRLPFCCSVVSVLCLYINQGQPGRGKSINNNNLLLTYIYTAMLTFLVHFVQAHVNFRLAELDALAKLENIHVIYDHDAHCLESPFMLIQLKSIEDAKKLVRRSILIKEIALLFAKNSSQQSIIDDLKTNIDLFKTYQDKTFKFIVSGFGRAFSLKEQHEVVELFSFLKFRGSVDLKSPKNTFLYLEDWREVMQHHERQLHVVYFGLKVTEGDRSSVAKYDLKKRAYLGTTSMDPELALVMANVGLVRKNSIVLDPFVGTGSFLIAGSHFDAMVMGADIDGRQLRGKSAYVAEGALPAPNLKLPTSTKPSKRDIKMMKENHTKSVHDNIRQYNIEGNVLDNIVTDLAHHPWRKQEIWDAIICDPPYGVRAGAKKIGGWDETKGNLENNSCIKDNGIMRYPNTIPYEMDEVLLDLIRFSATYLTVGGRLVFWLPTLTDEFSIQDIPHHPQFQLVANCEQVFGKWSRRMIALEKIQFTNTEEDWEDKRIHEPAHDRFRDVYFVKKAADKSKENEEYEK